MITTFNVRSRLRAVARKRESSCAVPTTSKHPASRRTVWCDGNKAASQRPEPVLYCAISGTVARIHNKADSNSFDQSGNYSVSQSVSTPTTESMGHPSHCLSGNAQSRYRQSSSRTARQHEHWHRWRAAVPFILMSCQAQPPQPVAVCPSPSSVECHAIPSAPLAPRQMSPPSDTLTKLFAPSSAGGDQPRVHLNVPHF